MPSYRHCFLDGYCCCAPRYVDADFGQSVDKQLTVFGFADGLNWRSQDIHTEFAQHTSIVQFETAIQSGLAAERDHDSIRPFLFDHLRHEMGIYRKKIDLIG